MRRWDSSCDGHRMQAKEQSHNNINERPTNRSTRVSSASSLRRLLFISFVASQHVKASRLSGHGCISTYYSGRPAPATIHFSDDGAGGGRGGDCFEESWARTLEAASSRDADESVVVFALGVRVFFGRFSDSERVLFFSTVTGLFFGPNLLLRVDRLRC